MGTSERDRCVHSGRGASPPVPERRTRRTVLFAKLSSGATRLGLGFSPTMFQAARHCMSVTRSDEDEPDNRNQRSPRHLVLCHPLARRSAPPFTHPRSTNLPRQPVLHGLWSLNAHDVHHCIGRLWCGDFVPMPVATPRSRSLDRPSTKPPTALGPNAQSMHPTSQAKAQVPRNPAVGRRCPQIHRKGELSLAMFTATSAKK